VTRARRLLDWEPEVGLDEGLRRLHASLVNGPTVTSPKATSR
jgi:hypothetical protein